MINLINLRGFFSAQLYKYLQLQRCRTAKPVPSTANAAPSNCSTATATAFGDNGCKCSWRILHTSWYIPIIILFVFVHSIILITQYLYQEHGLSIISKKLNKENSFFFQDEMITRWIYLFCGASTSAIWRMQFHFMEFPFSARRVCMSNFLALRKNKSRIQQLAILVYRNDKITRKPSLIFLKLQRIVIYCAIFVYLLKYNLLSTHLLAEERAHSSWYSSCCRDRLDMLFVYLVFPALILKNRSNRS